MRFSLLDFRKSLDNIDEAIVILLAERFRITEKIGRLKAKKNLPPQDKTREKEKLEKLSQIARSHGLEPLLIRRLFRLIFNQVVKNHKKIASR